MAVVVVAVVSCEDDYPPPRRQPCRHRRWEYSAPPATTKLPAQHSSENDPKINT